MSAREQRRCAAITAAISVRFAHAPVAFGDLLPAVRLCPVIRQEPIAVSVRMVHNDVIFTHHKPVQMAAGRMDRSALRIKSAAAANVFHVALINIITIILAKTIVRQTVDLMEMTVAQ